MGIKFSNFGRALVASAPSGTTGLAFTVEAGKGLLFPALAAGDYFYGVFKDASGNREIVKVDARASDSMTIAVGGRGLDGTTARTWAAGDYFVAGMVKIAIEESLSNANLNAIATLSTGVDTLPYFTGSGTAALTGLSAFARSLLDDATAAGMHLTLGTQALINSSVGASAFPSGTLMLFYQASAPTGWTKSTAQNNKALRVVSGTGGVSGGTVGFSTAFDWKGVSGSVGSTTLTSSQIPAHSHSAGQGYDGSVNGNFFAHSAAVGTGILISTQNTGGGGSHNHTFSGNSINMDVMYIDLILASKN